MNRHVRMGAKGTSYWRLASLTAVLVVLFMWVSWCFAYLKQSDGGAAVVAPGRKFIQSGAVNSVHTQVPFDLPGPELQQRPQRQPVASLETAGQLTAQLALSATQLTSSAAQSEPSATQLSPSPTPSETSSDAAAGAAAMQEPLHPNTNSNSTSPADTAPAAAAGSGTKHPSPSKRVVKLENLRGGNLFSWGLADNWRLGRMSGNLSVPELAIELLQVTSVAGSRHSLISTAQGDVWSMGLNSSRGGGGHGSKPIPASGQLGRKTGGPAPGRVEGLQGAFIVQVASGRFHSLAVAADGSLYSWGLNDHGQLGRSAYTLKGEACVDGHDCHSPRATKVLALTDVQVVAAAAGRYVSVALDSAGRLHTWGYDGCATQGVVPPVNERWHPKVVSGALDGHEVVKVDVGYSIWIAATAAGDVFTCHTHDDGYAGTLHPPEEKEQAAFNRADVGRDGDPHVPGQITALGGKSVVAVAAGRLHCLVATAEGEVYSWGGYPFVLGRPGGRELPALVQGDLAGDKIVHVAAGEYFSLAASKHYVYGWGFNGYQTIGNGDLAKEVPVPVHVAGWLGSGVWTIHAIAAGFQHAFAIAVHPVGPVSGDPARMHSFQTIVLPAADSGTPVNSTAVIVAAGTAASAQSAGQGSIATAIEEAARQSGEAADGAAAANVDVAYHTAYLAQVSAPSMSAADTWSSYQRSPKHAAIAATSPDVFNAMPAKLDPQFRNPCWLESPSYLRCMPYYQIIGVSKCGTTDLFHRLSQHPELYPATNKGPHFWDECPYPPVGTCTVPPTGDFAGYLRLFDAAARLITDHPTGITGEASSNTYTSANGVYLRGPAMTRADLNVTMPELLREVSPWLRLILIFRNPVERYYSAYHYYRWWKKDEPPVTPQSFHDAAMKEMAEWEGCRMQHSQAACVRRFHPQQLVKGMYAEFLDDWRENFPPQQLLILRNEDYKVTQKQHMAAVFTFLGVRVPDDSEWDKILAMPVRNKKAYAPMLPETRRVLEAFYQPFNERLAHLLGDKRYLWQDAATARDATT